MFEKIIKYIVYLLGILIIIAFFAVIYGMYIKISSKTSSNNDIEEVISLSLSPNEQIKNIVVLNNSRILILISNSKEIQGIIFDVESQKIIQRIKK